MDLATAFMVVLIAVGVSGAVSACVKKDNLHKLLFGVTMVSVITIVQYFFIVSPLAAKAQTAPAQLSLEEVQDWQKAYAEAGWKCEAEAIGWWRERPGNRVVMDYHNVQFDWSIEHDLDVWFTRHNAVLTGNPEIKTISFRDIRWDSSNEYPHRVDSDAKFTRVKFTYAKEGK